MSDEELLDINDPRVPDIVREHGRKFRSPATHVEDLGEGEFVLYAADGELLDMVYLT